jgi:hypothetical protein
LRGWNLVLSLVTFLRWADVIERRNAEARRRWQLDMAAFFRERELDDPPPPPPECVPDPPGTPRHGVTRIGRAQSGRRRQVPPGRPAMGSRALLPRITGTRNR